MTDCYCAVDKDCAVAGYKCLSGECKVSCNDGFAVTPLFDECFCVGDQCEQDEICSSGTCKTPIGVDPLCRSDWDCSDEQHCAIAGSKCVNNGDKTGVCYRASDCKTEAVCGKPGLTHTPDCGSADNQRSGRNCGEGVDGCLTCNDGNTACGSCIDSFH